MLIFGVALQKAHVKSWIERLADKELLIIIHIRGAWSSSSLNEVMFFSFYFFLTWFQISATCLMSSLNSPILTICDTLQVKTHYKLHHNHSHQVRCKISEHDHGITVQARTKCVKVKT